MHFFSRHPEQKKERSLATGIAFHIGLLLLAMLPLLSHQLVVPKQEETLFNLELPTRNQGDVLPDSSGKVEGVSENINPE